MWFDELPQQIQTVSPPSKDVFPTFSMQMGETSYPQGFLTESKLCLGVGSYLIKELLLRWTTNLLSKLKLKISQVQTTV